MTEQVKQDGSVTGLEAAAPRTTVFVGRHPADPTGWAIHLTTGSTVTAFGISAETLDMVLRLMMKQGGFCLPGMPGVRIVSAEDALGVAA